MLSLLISENSKNCFIASLKLNTKGHLILQWKYTYVMMFIPYDLGLIKEQIFFPLYRTPNMKIIVDIIIQNIPQVEEIDLSCNKIHTLEEIERIIPVCTNLKRLNLEKNKASFCSERLWFIVKIQSQHWHEFSILDIRI